MLTLIIVDDEKLLTDSLKGDIDWASLGFDKVFTAYNSRQAKEIFDRESIHLMVCDIEMPQGSGLELLAWVREHHPDTETVFMTCHAEFKLAQRAMQLGSFDYLLKPVPPDELLSVGEKVVAKIMKESEEKQYSRIGQFWSRRQPLIAEQFWLDLLHHVIPSNPDSIKREAGERGIPFDEKLQLLPLLISVKRYHKDFSPRDQKVLEYALKNSGEETLGLEGQGLLFTTTDRELMALIPIEGDAALLREQFKEKARPLIDYASEYFYCDIAIYIGNAVQGHELNGMVGRLRELDKENIALAKDVFLYDSARKTRETITFPDMHAWSIMLKEGHGGRVLVEAKAFLWTATASMDVDSLYRFHHNFLQMVFYVLKIEGIDAQLLFGDDKSADLFRNASRSVPDMVGWMTHIIGRSMDQVRNIRESPSILDKVEQYVNARLDSEQLSREDVAAYMFLNPDYLDRLLKKQTGHSVTELIITKRMALALELLLKTELPVGTIAVQSGYSNLAHFSRRFKRFAGLSPHEYRKKYVANSE
ncbi:response regulator [Paenibacillus algorifonticola]|uniref:response regulator transcription factor n=1 Tax=Paenibacillus algorifonticola TaxID=684063 RepID=UPI003D26EE16